MAINLIFIFILLPVLSSGKYHRPVQPEWKVGNEYLSPLLANLECGKLEDNTYSLIQASGHLNYVECFHLMTHSPPISIELKVRDSVVSYTLLFSQLKYYPHSYSYCFPTDFEALPDFGKITKIEEVELKLIFSQEVVNCSMERGRYIDIYRKGIEKWNNAKPISISSPEACKCTHYENYYDPSVCWIAN